MRTAWAGERGEMGLMPLLVAISIFVVVLAATLVTFQNFTTLRNRNSDRNASQDAARTSEDRLVRELRNLASPTIAQPQAVDKADPYDLVFQTVDPNGPNSGANAANIKRVRWCLDQSTPSNEKLYIQEQTWTSLTPPAAPSTSSCPSGAWATSRVLASNLTNTYGGQNRPLFTYNDTTLTAISQIHVDVFTDIDPSRSPQETHLTSGVYLRNQNQAPHADFSYVVSGTSAIVLNGSPSYDPEGEALTYVWYDGTTKIGSGITYTYAVSANTNHSIKLTVLDPAGLPGDSPTKSIHVP